MPSSDWSNECNQMSNHRQLQCLCNRLFRRTSKKHQSSALLVIVRGILQWPEDYPHKGPVTQTIFLFYDVMMWTVLLTYTRNQLGLLSKIHVHGFFDTDIQEVSQHITNHKVVRPCGFYDQLTELRSVSNNPLNVSCFCPTLINHTRSYFVSMYESWRFQRVSNMGECD